MNGRLITAEVSGALFRLFVDLGRNHKFDVHLSGDKPKGMEFTKIHPGNLTVVVCDKPHGLRTGQTCELSVNLPQFRDGFSAAIEVLTDKSFAVDIDTSSLVVGGRDDPRTGERVVQVNGFVRPATSQLSCSFESLASQLRKHPKFDPNNEFESKELKKLHALLNTYLGYCSYTRKKGETSDLENFSKLLASGQADFGSLFDICFLQAEDIESVAKKFHLFSTKLADSAAINHLAASLTVVEAVKAVSHKLEPLQQWLIADWTDLALLNNATLNSNSKIAICYGVNSLGKAVEDLMKEQTPCQLTMKEDGAATDMTVDEFDVVISAACKSETYEILRRKCIAAKKAMVSIRFGGPGELISSTDLVIPDHTEVEAGEEMKQLQGGSFAAPPFCVVKNFPNQISHCILWAIEKFESLFRSKPELSNKFVQLVKESGDNTKDLDFNMAKATTNFFQSAVTNFEDCLYMARVKFEKYFDFKARQLVFNFPPDHKQDDGKRFWALPRQMPRPLDFEELILSSEACRSFLLSAAELYAKIYDIAVPGNVDESLQQFLTSERCKTLPNFTPKQKKIETSENPENVENGSAANGKSDEDNGIVEQAVKMAKTLGDKQKTVGAEALVPENRDSAGFRFVQAAANLRASMYGVGIGSITKGQVAKFVSAHRVPSDKNEDSWTLPAVEYFSSQSVCL